MFGKQDVQGSSSGGDVGKVEQIMVKRNKRGSHGKLGVGKWKMRIKRNRRFGYEKKSLDKGCERKFWDDKYELKRKEKWEMEP